MSRRLGATALALLLAAGPALAPAPARADDTVTVRLRLPVDPKMDSDGIRRVLVGGFLHNDFEPFDMEDEIVKLLRTDLRRSSDFLILDDPHPSLPEQRLEDLKGNAPFFMAIAEDYRADLIISGQVTYGAVDRSGFVTEEYISPVTGRRTIRTRYVERTGFSLRLDLIFVKGSDGTLLYDTSFFQDEILPVETADALNVFYELTERFRDGYLGILVPRARTEIRYLFNE